MFFAKNATANGFPNQPQPKIDIVFIVISQRFLKYNGLIKMFSPKKRSIPHRDLVVLYPKFQFLTILGKINV
ncbi:MAG: hypothetical protein CFE22_14320 [Cytophagaceae bacterium BCCC1]|nr:MAG: hypothetical protein CFE22_14320 [Cytophagaceae bacterium BCCC1]